MKFLFLAVALLSSVVGHAAKEKCVGVLTGSATENFIAYVAELHSFGVVTDADLVSLANSDVGLTLLNPIPVDRTTTNTSAAVARAALADLIAENRLDAHAIQEWARAKLIERGVARKRRDEVKNKTRRFRQKMEFHRVEPGRFMMGEPGKQIEVILTHPIEVMSTQVTQQMWLAVMGVNPSKFQGPNHSDHPVENVTWWSVVEYANRLSIKAGLKPVYDLSTVRFMPRTRAEDGSLDGDGKGRNLVVNAPDGNTYLAEGFRLPTEAEAEYLLRSAGAATGKYPFGDSEAELGSHAWYNANSNGSTHSVAELKPLVIHGNKFFDFYGNVLEWSFDWVFDALPGGENPQGPETGAFRAKRGGSWVNDEMGLRSSLRRQGLPNNRFPDLGFRLVRTLK